MLLIGPPRLVRWQLCTATDWRLLSSDACVQFVQTRMGASTGWGGSARLAEIVGTRAAALRLLLHQPRLDASAAAAAGLADALAPNGEDAVSAAMELLLNPAREKAASVGAIRAMKAAVHAATPIDDATAAAETDAFAHTWGSPPNRKALESAADAIASRRKRHCGEDGQGQA